MSHSLSAASLQQHAAMNTSAGVLRVITRTDNTKDNRSIALQYCVNTSLPGLLLGAYNLHLGPIHKMEQD
jgi:hypothetical protein